MRRWRSLTLLGLAALAGVPGCGDDHPGADPGADRAADRAAEAPPGGAAAVRDADSGAVRPASEIRVWFHRGEEPVAVARRVVPVPGGTPVEAALAELLAGPTSEERTAGLSSWFSDTTRSALRGTRLREGFLVVDLTRLPALIPGAGSSAGSEALLASLDSTVFQFQAVDSVEYRLDGSCEAFWSWLQRDCVVVRRP